MPLTSAQRWCRSSPTTVLFRAGECTLPKTCAALAHQLTTIDRDKIRLPRIGVLSAAKMAEVDAALRNYLVL